MRRSGGNEPCCKGEEEDESQHFPQHEIKIERGHSLQFFCLTILEVVLFEVVWILSRKPKHRRFGEAFLCRKPLSPFICTVEMSSMIQNLSWLALPALRVRLLRCAASRRGLSASSSRTGTTAALWAERAEWSKYKSQATKAQSVLLDKAPADSLLSIDLPLLSDPKLRDQYTNFRGGVRFGRILEDIDSFAANIGKEPSRFLTTTFTLTSAPLDSVSPLRRRQPRHIFEHTG